MELLEFWSKNFEDITKSNTTQ